MKTCKITRGTKTPSNGVVWAFDLSKVSIVEAVRQGTPFFHKASFLNPAEFWKIKKGLKLSLAPVQELRLMASLLSLPTVWNTGHRRF
jgi:hypothetical protein